MKFIADLHVHSAYSRATSAAAHLEGFHTWARIKGINLVGTGDFTHPGWLTELKEKLVAEGNGFFRLAESSSVFPSDFPGISPAERDVRFCLSSEISSIYKKNGATRKVHSVIFAPDFETVARINARLGSIGNLKSDGRPILGLDPKILLSIVKEASPDAHLVPAHIWTPWFSVFGSKSGFDTLDECFEDLTGEIFALETGLSSDPLMNWRLSGLDRYSLISNSDAHSPQKLGREANVFDTDFGYGAMFDALRSGKGFEGTLEFYPEEGKYHFDGHRKCGTCLDPSETLRLDELCPRCGKPVTVGVMHRVIELSDRQEPMKPARAPGFRYIIPLEEIVAEINRTGTVSKSVRSAYSRIISEYGSEFAFLLDASVNEVSERLGPAFGEALARMREGRVRPQPGYDGEFGFVRIFSGDELKEFAGQGSLFVFDSPRAEKRKSGGGSAKNTGRQKKNSTQMNGRLPGRSTTSIPSSRGSSITGTDRCSSPPDRVLEKRGQLSHGSRDSSGRIRRSRKRSVRSPSRTGRAGK
jgi:DNA helicase-2/ATP-dependent DNA helicase PcrA